MSLFDQNLSWLEVATLPGVWQLLLVLFIAASVQVGVKKSRKEAD